MTFFLTALIIATLTGWLARESLLSRRVLRRVDVPPDLRIRVGRGEDSWHYWGECSGNWHAFTAEQIVVARARAKRLTERGIKP